MPDCKTCELVERRDAGNAPLWDNILRTPRWDLQMVAFKAAN